MVLQKLYGDTKDLNLDKIFKRPKGFTPTRTFSEYRATVVVEGRYTHLKFSLVNIAKILN